MLELAVAQDPVLNAEAHKKRMAEKHLQAIQTIYNAFPKACRKRFLEKLTSENPKYEGISDLIIYAKNGVYEPCHFPPEVAEIYLTDPEATPWLRCASCRVLLPRRSGFWVKEGFPSFWQGSLNYFKECPGCGGQIIHRGTEQPLELSTYLPIRPEPPWQFLKHSPN